MIYKSRYQRSRQENSIFTRDEYYQMIDIWNVGHSDSGGKDKSRRSQLVMAQQHNSGNQ